MRNSDLNLNRVLASPALPVLLALEAAGVQIEVEGDHLVFSPRGRLTDEQRNILRAHKTDAMRLVQLCDPGVQERRAVFARQLAEAPAGTLPTFVLAPAPPYVRGWCFACRDALPTMRYGRCWRCSLAWRLAAGVRLSGEAAAARDDARVMA